MWSPAGGSWPPLRKAALPAAVRPRRWPLVVHQRWDMMRRTELLTAHDGPAEVVSGNGSALSPVTVGRALSDCIWGIARHGTLWPAKRDTAHIEAGHRA